jgi:hypothetical protein
MLDPGDTLCGCCKRAKGDDLTVGMWPAAMLPRLLATPVLAESKIFLKMFRFGDLG